MRPQIRDREQFEEEGGGCEKFLYRLQERRLRAGLLRRPVLARATPGGERACRTCASCHTLTGMNTDDPPATADDLARCAPDVYDTLDGPWNPRPRRRADPRRLAAPPTDDTWPVLAMLAPTAAFTVRSGTGLNEPSLRVSDLRHYGLSRKSSSTSAVIVRRSPP